MQGNRAINLIIEMIDIRKAQSKEKERGRVDLPLYLLFGFLSRDRLV